MATETWVWIHLPGALEPTLCGRMRHEGSVGSFVYGRSYLALDAAVPIDPIALPLRSSEFQTPHFGGWFSAMLDGGPDAWGKRIIDRHFGAQDQRGYLLHAYGQPVGALSFSELRDVAPASTAAMSYPSLAETLALHARVEAGEPITAEESHRLLGEAGSGGARPKLTLEVDGRLWLVKGESIRDNADLAPVPITEAALLTLARDVQITAPALRLERIRDRPVLLVERFDRAAAAGGFSRWRYASAQTLFWSAPEVARRSYTGSYTNLARRMTLWEAAPQAHIQELFRRIVFNALVGNLDDHDKNHGLVAGADGSFRLAPVFDLTISATSAAEQQLAMTFGSEGALISLDNLLSECQCFGHSPESAEQMIRAQWAHLQTHALERFMSFGCDEARAARTLALMPGHRMLPDTRRKR